MKAFLDELKAFKLNIDEGTVAEINFKDIRPFLQLEHFQPEVIEKRNSAAAGLCSWGNDTSPFLSLSLFVCGLFICIIECIDEDVY